MSFNVVAFPTLFCFGDSLTQRSFNVEDGCWAAFLASRYQRKLDVLNRGFSAYNSQQAVHLLPRLLPSAANSKAGPPYAMLIWFGANDCSVPGTAQHVSLENYDLNLRTIIQHATESIGVPLERVILLTPPKYDHAAWVAHKAKDGVSAEQVGRSENLCELYAERCVSIATQKRMKIVDVCAAMKAEPHFESLLIDGLHFNTKGAKFVASLLQPLLDPMVEKLPVIFPDKEHIDFENAPIQLANWRP